MSEEQMIDAQEENRLVALRREKLAAIRAERVAFPNKFRRDAYAADLQEQFKEAGKEELLEAGHKVRVAGRIMLNRGAFMEIQDASGRIQFT